MYRLYVKTLVFIRSLFCNIIFWMFNFTKYSKIKKLKKHYKINVRNINNVAHTMKSFKWTKDKYMDWRPWVITFLAKDMKDDCDGAATFGKWLLENIGVECNLVRLYNKTEGHLICVSKSNMYIISNNEFLYNHSGDKLDKRLKELFPQYDKYMIL